MDKLKRFISILKKWISNLGLTEDERVFFLLFAAASLLAGACGCILAYWMLDVWVCS